MKKVYLVIGICLLAAMLSVSAVAGAEKGKQPMGPGMMMQKGGAGEGAAVTAGMVLRLKEKLELTDEQVTKLEAIDAKVKAANEAVQAKTKALWEAVQSKAKESAIRTLATELGNAMGNQAVLQVSTQAEIDVILTDAQKAKLKELKPQRGMNAEAQKDWGDRSESMRTRYSEEAFTRIDTNGDGVISLEEYKNQMGPMRERRGVERPKGPKSEGKQK